MRSKGAQDVARGMQFGGVDWPRVRIGQRRVVRREPDVRRRGNATLVRRTAGERRDIRSDGEWSRRDHGGAIARGTRGRRGDARRSRASSTPVRWNTSVRMQLQLGTDRVGVRGYEGSRTGGGRRAVAAPRGAAASFRGSRNTSGFGGAAFVDAGKMWAGDVPFGETVNPRVGAGIGSSSRCRVRAEQTCESTLPRRWFRTRARIGE